MTNHRAVAVIKRNGKILCIQRRKNDQDYYVFPGGTVEEGESYKQGLSREVAGETGFTIKHFKYLFELHNQGRTENWFNVEVGDTCEPTLGGPELNRQSHDNSYQFVWLTLTEIKSLPNIYPAEAIEKLRN